MKTVLEMYRQGMGPNSTLNMVPYQACLDVTKEIRMKRCKVSHVEIILYNEYARLAQEAGIIHDIEYAFAYSNCKYVITTNKPVPPVGKDKPYIFDIVVYSAPDNALFRHRILATGGGSYRNIDRCRSESLPFSTFEDIKKWFKDNPKATYLDFASINSNPEDVKSMFYRGLSFADIACLNGIKTHGELHLPNPDIHYVRQARNIWLHDENQLAPCENANRIISAFSYAISEEICEKRVIISSPTICTTSILWSIMLYLKNELNIPQTKLIEGFCAAGIFCALVDHKAALDPIEIGCQGPIGTACGMAAVVCAVALYDANIEECGRAFGMAIEHSLGIICDALSTYPIIPCIQRCSAFATRAYEIAIINHSLMATPELCKLDDLIQVLIETGGDLIAKNRRLGVGGFIDHAPYSLKKATEKDWE